MIGPLSLVRGVLGRVLGDIVPSEARSVDDGAEVVGVMPGRRRGASGSSTLTRETAARSRQALEFSRRLPHEPAAVPEARGALEPLATVVDREAFGNLRLLVSEVVTNSVRHGSHGGSAPIELSVVAAPHRVRGEVADGGAGFAPAARSDRADEGSGWGLHLVDLLSDRWGVERNGRTVVWFELEAAVEPPAGPSESGYSDALPKRRNGTSPGEAERRDGVGSRLSAVRSLLPLGREPELDVD